MTHLELLSIFVDVVDLTIKSIVFLNDVFVLLKNKPDLGVCWCFLQHMCGYVSFQRNWNGFAFRK